MILFEDEIQIPRTPAASNYISYFRQSLKFRMSRDITPLRFVVTRTEGGMHHCELAALRNLNTSLVPDPQPLFQFSMRPRERTTGFNAVFLVPTGIGAEVGGHAGDAAPTAQLLARVCDTLVTHPNVVNASDLNELPHNALYVEGSVICRLMMGTAGLQRVRSNRMLVILDHHPDALFLDAAINSVSAARASYGLKLAATVKLDHPLVMAASYTSSGRAVGKVRGLERVYRILSDYQGTFDAVAVSSIIEVPPETHSTYFRSQGNMINPWGGVEAMLTHAISSSFDVPSAHAPMLESREIANQNPGIVDPRMAAEAISTTFFQCVLKGLHRSPRIVTDPSEFVQQDIISSADISCLVIPDGCVGLPTLAALEQGIPVIAVRENKNVMRNDLTELPWAPDQFYIVENYWEAAGVMTALRIGIDPAAVRRPLAKTNVTLFGSSAQRTEREQSIAHNGEATVHFRKQTPASPK